MKSSQPLVAGSSEARAAWQITTGVPLVRLDPACPDPVASLATVIRLLRVGQRNSQNFGSDISVVVDSDVSRFRIAETLGMYLSGDDPVGPVTCGAQTYGVHDRHSTWQQVNMVPPRLNSPSAAHLLVVGLDNQPWRNARSIWDEEYQVTGDQVLMVGPDRDWPDPPFERLVTNRLGDPARVWGPPSTELILAGAPQ